MTARIGLLLLSGQLYRKCSDVISCCRRRSVKPSQTSQGTTPLSPGAFLSTNKLQWRSVRLSQIDKFLFIVQHRLFPVSKTSSRWSVRSGKRLINQHVYSYFRRLFSSRPEHKPDIRSDHGSFFSVQLNRFCHFDFQNSWLRYQISRQRKENVSVTWDNRCNVCIYWLILGQHKTV